MRIRKLSELKTLFTAGNRSVRKRIRLRLESINISTTESYPAEISFYCNDRPFSDSCKAWHRDRSQGTEVSYVGDGYGEGSILHANSALLSQVFVTPPDSLYQTYDFHLTTNSPLPDAGINAGIVFDKDNKTRIIGAAPDIDPYEYVISGPIAKSGEQMPLLIVADPDSGIFTLRSLESAEEITIVTASGIPVGRMPVSGGASARYVRLTGFG